jgi:hypothetical protein
MVSSASHSPEAMNQDEKRDSKRALSRKKSRVILIMAKKWHWFAFRLFLNREIKLLFEREEIELL